MSYQKHVWVTKEVISSKNLNHIEDGIYNEEQRALLAEEGLGSDIYAEYLRAYNRENEIEGSITTETGILDGKITANTNAINTLNGNSSTVGSVDYKIAQAIPNVEIMSETLVANATDVTFVDIPTSGNNLIDFYIDGGANYTAIDTSVAGEITLTYEATSSDRSVYCKIEGVS